MKTLLLYFLINWYLNHIYHNIIILKLYFINPYLLNMKYNSLYCLFQVSIVDSGNDQFKSSDIKSKFKKS